MRPCLPAPEKKNSLNEPSCLRNEFEASLSFLRSIGETNKAKLILTNAVTLMNLVLKSQKDEKTTKQNSGSRAEGEEVWKCCLLAVLFLFQ